MREILGKAPCSVESNIYHMLFTVDGIGNKTNNPCTYEALIVFQESQTTKICNKLHFIYINIICIIYYIFSIHYGVICGLPWWLRL